MQGNVVLISPINSSADQCYIYYSRTSILYHVLSVLQLVGDGLVAQGYTPNICLAAHLPPVWLRILLSIGCKLLTGESR
jgi:hypothetical protein